MVDRLAALLDRFPIAARVDAPGDGAPGPALWLLREGGLVVPGTGAWQGPGLLLQARADANAPVLPAPDAAWMRVRLHFEGGADNPLAVALPATVWMSPDALPGSDGLLALLFEEAFDGRCGRTALIEKLVEALLVQVLRQQMEAGALRGGLLAGMAHPRLRRALVAMHEAPAHPWSLDTLADAAGMSRSAFADAFRASVGQTPGQYLQGWRIGLAQRALRRGRPLKLIADEVGYGSEAALSRAFKAHSGVSPRAWRQARVAHGAAA